MKVPAQDNGPCADNTGTILTPVMCSTDIQALHKKNSSQGLQSLWIPKGRASVEEHTAFRHM